MTETRCSWCLGDPLYEDYHDNEWGIPCFDDQTLFEFLLLEGAQAGLSWITVLKKRENYRLAYDGFNAEKIAVYGDSEVEQLMNNPGIIRNRLKIQSAIKNARAYLNIIEAHGSFAQFIWQPLEGRPIQNQFRQMSDVPSATAQSDLMSKTLKNAGFNFVGSTICYAFMQATGMVNDHLTSCPSHQKVKAIAADL